MGGWSIRGRQRKSGVSAMIELIDDTGRLAKALQAAMTDAANSALMAEDTAGDISICICGPEEIKRLNREYRGMDMVTDVLSFPALEGADIVAPPGYLGDIMVCLDRAEEQAREYGHSLTRELCFLAVHGVLHLLGYDHMEPADEREMLARQKNIMEGTGIVR